MHQINNPSQPQELYQLLGKPEKYFSELSFNGHMNRVLNYVFNPNRKTIIRDYDLIKKALHDCWNVSCIEVSTAIEDSGPFKLPGKQLGRCSVRILHIFNPAQFYIVLDQESSIWEKRLALLHEIGHFILHFEMFQSIGTLYHRICLNPELEFEIGRFLIEKKQALSDLREQEADLFALTWLLPLWMDGMGNVNEVYNNISPELSKLGYKYKVFRDLFLDRANLVIEEATIPDLNSRGETINQRERSHRYSDINKDLFNRLNWLFFNRSFIINDISTERNRLLKEFFDVIGTPRYIPELKGMRNVFRKPFTASQYAWIRRVKLDDVENLIDSEHWEPLLACPLDGELPKYYIPITPVPSVNSLDSQVKWQHMDKTYALPYSLTSWFTRAHQQSVGLLIFPRNPAEKLLDEQRILR